MSYKQVQALGGPIRKGSKGETVVYAGDHLHPARKPVEILTPLIEAFSPKSGLVLDPFCGSGSTLAAASAAGRDWLGIELDADYHRIAARWLAA